MDSIEEKYFLGRPDGLGNRLEEIINLEAMCEKNNYLVSYIWNNPTSKNRSYDILFDTKYIKIISQLKYCLHDGNIKLANDFTQNEILKAASNIKPKFEVFFRNNIKPIGVHIRGTDRIEVGSNHPHFMKNQEEFNWILSKTIHIINRTTTTYIFICADDDNVKRKFIKYLNKSIKIINPICSDDSIPKNYIDLFGLSLCRKIYMCSKFSTFAITASMIGNIPIVSYAHDELVKRRYKALFEYSLGFDNVKYIRISRDKKWTKIKIKFRHLFAKIIGKKNSGT